MRSTKRSTNSRARASLEYLKADLSPNAADTFQAAFTVFAPPPNLTVSQWADRERQLSPEASSEPGRWDTSRAEYQRGVMDAVSNPLIHTVVMMTSSQVGKSEILLNLIGFHIDKDPAPLLVVQPTLEMAQAFSKDRVAPMVRDTPALAGKIAPVKTRDSGNTTLHKSFPGGHLTMVGANSPSGLASRPIRVVLADEVDRYDESAGTEGDPVNLAVKRTTTFWNRKIVLVSTPGIKGVSRIERAFAASDRRRYHVPCPDCGHEQALKWAQVHWSKEGDEGDLKHRPETAHYACTECGSLWGDVQRWTAVRKGRWIAEGEFTGVAGFHLSELYSPWRRLAAATGGGDTSQFLLTAQARARLPIYPEILSADGKMNVSSPASGTILVPAAVSFQHRGIYPVSTSDYLEAARTFTTAASKTYHLRWSPTGGFALKDVANAGYNPTALPQSDKAFDSSYDDMLIAKVVTSAGNVPTITNLINKDRLRWSGIITASNATAGVAEIVLFDYSQVLNWSRTFDYAFARSEMSWSGSAANGQAIDSDFALEHSNMVVNREVFSGRAAIDSGAQPQRFRLLAVA